MLTMSTKLEIDMNLSLCLFTFLYSDILLVNICLIVVVEKPFMAVASSVHDVGDYLCCYFKGC
jgi:hypothetical protein